MLWSWEQRTINKCFNFFWNMFYSKTIKISNIIIMNLQSNPMSSNIRVLIKIYFISPILYFGWIVSRINTIKSWLTLIIFLYLVKGWGGIKNPFYFCFYFHNQLLQSLLLLYLFLDFYQPYLFLNLLKYFLINLHLVYLITY